MEIIILFIAALIGFAFGWHSREQWAIRQVHRLLESGELFKQDEDEPDVDRTKMRLERNGEVIYAFTVEDDSFIAQGKDLEDLDKAITARFPGKKFSVQEQNLIDIKAEYHESV
jgi:hypothetical protein